MCLRVVEPFVPVANRKLLINTHAILLCFALSSDLLVCIIVSRTRIDRAHEQQRLSVRSPLGRARSRRKRSDTHGFAAVGDVEHINLADFVTFTPRRESNPAAASTPRHPPLATLAKRQPPRFRSPIRRDDPQIRNLILLVIRRLDE